MGFEPTRLAAPAFETGVTTNSTTPRSMEEGNRIELSPAHHRWNGFQDRLSTMDSTLLGAGTWIHTWITRHRNVLSLRSVRHRQRTCPAAVCDTFKIVMFGSGRWESNPPLPWLMRPSPTTSRPPAQIYFRPLRKPC